MRLTLQGKPCLTRSLLPHPHSRRPRHAAPSSPTAERFSSTRVYLDGQPEPTVWTGITSFLAEAPDPFESLVVFAPNPTSGDLRLLVDWAVVPNAQHVLVSIYDPLGRRVRTGIRIDRADGRFQLLSFGSDLPPGVYQASYIVDGNPNNPNNRGISSIVVQ